MTSTRTLAAVGGLSLLLFGAVAGAGGRGREPLRVCLEADSAPFSASADPDRGIDAEVAAFVADTLERPLQVLWFDASGDDDLPLMLQASALLSGRECDLIAGYPLTWDGLVGATPARPLPASEIASSRPLRSDRLRSSRPYMSLPLTLVTTLDDPGFERLEDVAGRRLAVERGSLASAIATVYAGARLQPDILRLSAAEDDSNDEGTVPAEAIFEALETGAADVAFVEEHRFEFYRRRVPGTRLKPTGYRHGLAVNTGFVAFSQLLVDEIDRALEDLLSSGRMAALVEAQGLRYAPPVVPAVLPPLTPRLLAGRAPTFLLDSFPSATRPPAEPTTREAGETRPSP